jgi:hypothetical protein
MRGHQEHSLPPPGKKFIEWDHTMGEGMIKGQTSRFQHNP